jgi:hypothetical protein
MSLTVALHLVLCLLLDIHEIVRMSFLQNVRIGLVTTMLKGLNEYLLVLYFPHSLPVWVNIGMGDLHLLLLSSCNFLQIGSVQPILCLRTCMKCCQLFFNFSSDLDTVKCRRGSHSLIE